MEIFLACKTSSALSDGNMFFFMMLSSQCFKKAGRCTWPRNSGQYMEMGYSGSASKSSNGISHIWVSKKKKKFNLCVFVGFIRTSKNTFKPLLAQGDISGLGEKVQRRGCFNETSRSCCSVSSIARYQLTGDMWHRMVTGDNRGWLLATLTSHESWKINEIEMELYYSS